MMYLGKNQTHSKVVSEAIWMPFFFKIWEIWKILRVWEQIPHKQWYWKILKEISLFAHLFAVGGLACAVVLWWVGGIPAVLWVQECPFSFPWAFWGRTRGSSRPGLSVPPQGISFLQGSPELCCPCGVSLRHTAEVFTSWWRLPSVVPS